MKRMTVRLCIFDMDGTLIDSERWYFGYAMETIKKNGFPVSEEFILSMMGSNVRRQEMMWTAEYGDLELYHRYHDEIRAHMEEYLKDHPIPLKKGVFELFDFLKKESIPIALATSTSREEAKYRFRNEKLMSYFDFIVYGDDIGNSKPAPDIFLRSMEHFRISPEDTVIFEDSGSGLLASHAAGAFTVYIPDIAPVFEETEAAIGITLNDLGEGISLIRTLQKQ